jgi:hypothetical protein
MFAPTQEAKNEKVNTYGKKVKKQKLFEGVEMSESCRIQSQEVQELGSPGTATTDIAQTSGVTQSVDLTNKGMGDHYFRDVHGFRPPLCVRGPYL